MFYKILLVLFFLIFSTLEYTIIFLNAFSLQFLVVSLKSIYPSRVLYIKIFFFQNFIQNYFDYIHAPLLFLMPLILTSSPYPSPTFHPILFSGLIMQWSIIIVFYTVIQKGTAWESEQLSVYCYFLAKTNHKILFWKNFYFMLSTLI